MNIHFSREDIKEILMHSFAVVGFVVVAFVGIVGIIQIVTVAPKILSNLAAVTTFKSVFVPNEQITIVTTNSPTPSGTVFEFAWEHLGKPKDGTYTFRYACREGLTFQIPNEDSVNENIQCNSPFSFISDTNSLFLIPISKTSRYIDVPIVITSIDNANEPTTLDDSLLTIINENVPENVTSSSGNTNARTQLVAGEQKDEVFPISDSRVISNQNGQVDLIVRIIDTGVIDANNVFTPTSSFKVTDQGAIRFSVTNIGSKTSDNWTFNAVLPTFPMHIFHSTSQNALAPGDRIDFTLGFNQLSPRLTQGVITINVDPTGSIRNEFNRDNNIVQATITIIQ